MQGILEAICRFERMLCEISGIDRFTLPARRRHAGRLRERVHDPRLPRAHAASRSATRSSRRSSRTPATAPAPATAGLQGRHALRRRPRLPGRRRAQGGRLRAHGGPDDHEPGGHGHLQPAHRRVRRGRARGGRPLRTTTRRTRTGSSGSRGPATPASTSASSTCTRRSRRPTARWACPCGASGVTSGARALPAVADRRVRRRPLLPRLRPARRRSARCAPSTACRRPSCARTPGCCRWAPRACARSPRSPCSTTTTSRRRSRSSRASQSRTRTATPTVGSSRSATASRRLKEDTGVGTLDVARRTSDFGVAQLLPEPRAVARSGADDPRAGGDGVDGPISTRTPRCSRRSRARPTPSRRSCAPRRTGAGAQDRSGAARRPERLGAHLARPTKTGGRPG